MNASPYFVRDQSPVTTETAEYALTVRLLTASVALRSLSADRVGVEVTNRSATIEEPVIEWSVGTQATHRAAFLATGLPNQFTIDVPKDASTLVVHARSADPGAARVELYLYDCSSGECFSYDFTVPALPRQTLIVRKPKPGRWVAAVNPAPFPAVRGELVLDAIVTGVAHRQSAQSPIITLPSSSNPQSGTPNPQFPVLLAELVDAAAERDARKHPWENRAGLTNLAERTVSAGMAILPLK